MRLFSKHIDISQYSSDYDDSYQVTPYFTYGMFRCSKCISNHMCIDTIRLLEKARTLSQAIYPPIHYKIVHGYVCNTHIHHYSKVEGNKIANTHTTGRAVDIACNDSISRYSILYGLLNSGISRIGIYSNHIHVDTVITGGYSIIYVGDR